MQRKRAARTPVDGVLVLDKPIGLSSNAAMMRARTLLDARKAGHGGTLDPLATGVLPILLGEATKFAADLLDADKTYEATLTLGVSTTTGDAEGEVVQQVPVADGTLTADAVRAACVAFVGEITQVPPMYSALKHNGQPLYAYARAGIELERAARRVHVHAIEVLTVGLSPPTACATIRVHCSKGTYIRTLAEDIGARLGCGAHVAALRRVAAGPLSIAQAVTLEALDAMSIGQRVEQLLAPDALLQTLACVDLSSDDAQRFGHGQRITLGAPYRHGLQATAQPIRVRVYGASRLLGIGEVSASGLLAPLRLVAQPARQQLHESGSGSCSAEPIDQAS